MSVRTEDICREQAAALVRACFDDWINMSENRGGFVPQTGSPDLERSEQASLSQERIDDLREQIFNKQFDGVVVNAAGPLIDRLEADGEVSEARRTDVLEGVARAMVEEQVHFLLRLSNRLAPYKPEDALFSSAASPSAVAQFSQHPTITHRGPTVGETVRLYLDAGARKWRPKTLAARKWQLRYLEEGLGSDTSIGSVTSHDIRRFRDQVLSLRANHGRSKVQSFAQKQTDNLTRRIAPKTAALIFEPCKALFNWAKANEGMIAFNPAQDVHIEHSKAIKNVKSRRPFIASELATLFSSSTFTGCKSRHRRY